MKTAFTLIGLGLLFLVTSCESKRNYKYVEIKTEQLLNGEVDTTESQQKIIQSTNDSLAFIEAVNTFLISIEVNRKVYESMGKITSTPIGFKLLNEDNIDISKSIFIKNKDSLTIKIDNEISSLKKFKDNYSKNILKKKKEQLIREIKSIDKGVDFSTYRESIDALQIELVLFGTWANMIIENRGSEDPEILKLVKRLKHKVTRLQIKEFPVMRKEYAKVIGEKLWENDIKVFANGKGYKYINFTGGIFATNKNKKDFQTELHEILTLFRFKQSRYRWYKGEDEYTYYTIYKGKDTELVMFRK